LVSGKARIWTVLNIKKSCADRNWSVARLKYGRQRKTKKELPRLHLVSGQAGIWTALNMKQELR